MYPTSEFADEKCMAIMAKSLSLAFLICDDNIGGCPAAFPPLGYWDAVFAPAPAPDHLVTMRLGREHYRDGGTVRQSFDLI